MTLFYTVRALAFNVDTVKPLANPSSEVDKQQISCIFYIALFSGSALTESSKRILNSLPSDGQKAVGLVDRWASAVFVPLCSFAVFVGITAESQLMTGLNGDD